MLTARQPELMSKDVFNKFIIADSILAWELVGEEVLNRLTGEYVIPMPDFSTRGYPCAPGMVILTKHRRKIRDILKPPYRVFSEFLWDFHPSSRSSEQESTKYYKNESVLMRTTETESDDDLKFEMHLSGMRRTRVKTIKIAFKGLHVEELKYEDVDLPGRPVSVRHLGAMNTRKINMVTKTFSVDRGRIEVWIDDDVDIYWIDTKTVLGFLVCGLTVKKRKNRVKDVFPISPKSFTSKWINRWMYKNTFHNAIPNANKYGGGAGDVLGPGNRPYSANPP